MNTFGHGNFDPPTEAVLGIIGKLMSRASEDRYIFRGEPECYDKVTSTLYRQRQTEFVDGALVVEVVQRVMLLEARTYTNETDDNEILSTLQHYGSPTNLIDFTTDIHIALFFACGHPDKDGRVILQPARSTGEFDIIQARQPASRVVPQKSIFVRPRKGFIEPEQGQVIVIPKELKPVLLAYLRRYCNVTAETLFNDLHGFIRLQGVYNDAYTAYYQGTTSLSKGNPGEAIKHLTESIRLNANNSPAYGNRGVAYYYAEQPEKAMQDYELSIAFNPENAYSYVNRGELLLDKSELDEALRDCKKALELKPGFAQAHFICGLVQLHRKEWNEARDHFLDALDEELDVTSEFRKKYGIVEDFEKTHGIQLPPDIKHVLRMDSDNC